jgi:GNAT superfamily N-acetyltransferase
MKINYKRDEKLEHKQDILYGLGAYNNTFAGDAPSDSVFFYVFDKDKLIASCHAELSWNWIYIEKLFYENQEGLNTMMSEVYHYFKGKAEGVYFESYIESQVNEFELAGFKIIGSLVEKPIGFNTMILVNKEMNELSTDNHFKIKIVNEEDKKHSNHIKEQIDRYNEIHNIDTSKNEIEYVALDQDKVIGGVYGYLIQDYLYVSLLWVDETYRGNDIATKLMDCIEDEAKEEGYKRFYLGTCTFQAAGFYEKRGYKLNVVISNCPKGYDDHMMVKTVNP